MSAPVLIPDTLSAEFRQFRRDFDHMAAVWCYRGEETPTTMDAARESLREYLSDPSDPDAYGMTRVERLQELFAWWRWRAADEPNLRIGVVPTLSYAAEARAADDAWRRAHA